MNNDEFILWFKGFVDALGTNYPNQTQWEVVLNKLKELESPKPDWLTNPGTWVVPNTGLPPWPQPYYIADFNKIMSNTHCNHTGEATTSNITYNKEVSSTLT